MVNYGKTYFTSGPLAPYWLFVLGAMFIAVTLLLPRGKARGCLEQAGVHQRGHYGGGEQRFQSMNHEAPLASVAGPTLPQESRRAALTSDA